MASKKQVFQKVFDDYMENSDFDNQQKAIEMKSTLLELAENVENCFLKNKKAIKDSDTYENIVSKTSDEYITSKKDEVITLPFIEELLRNKEIIKNEAEHFHQFLIYKNFQDYKYNNKNTTNFTDFKQKFLRIGKLALIISLSNVLNNKNFMEDVVKNIEMFDDENDKEFFRSKSLINEYLRLFTNYCAYFNIYLRDINDFKETNTEVENYCLLCRELKNKFDKEKELKNVAFNVNTLLIGSDAKKKEIEELIDISTNYNKSVQINNISELKVKLLLSAKKASLLHFGSLDDEDSTERKSNKISVKSSNGESTKINEITEITIDKNVEYWVKYLRILIQLKSENNLGGSGQHDQNTIQTSFLDYNKVFTIEEALSKHVDIMSKTNYNMKFFTSSISMNVNKFKKTIDFKIQTK